MDDKIDWRFLLTDTRARIYLLWAILTTFGFAVIHFATHGTWVNIMWLVLSVIGLGYMYKVMPLRVKVARRIFYAWLVPITFGMALSILAFYIDALARLIPHLGSFWLFMMAAGYLLNGLFDPPSTWYWVVGVLNITAGLLCVYWNALIPVQWLVIAVISGWSMLNLWLFRT